MRWIKYGTNLHLVDRMWSLVSLLDVVAGAKEDPVDRNVKKKQKWNF